ncbi:hypothetical protein [Thermomonospora cellulosilytica]|uniref:Uncharacterized protein n=1 Tax=Thermomonospora cellulosilytica TaxID=1411118 RepID=A0A7W3MW59_9ACTN|nr:hypothetical protein [Thermomonospora cellulosilytica]MBA9003027.1 hypothetical protein [Thermomonospora cellulosilytica]
MYDGVPKEPVLVINVAHNLNNGVVKDQYWATTSGPLSDRPVAKPGVRLPDAVLTEASRGFVPPSGIREARRRLREGIVFLSGERGTGRRTMALNLLRGSRGCGAVIHRVDADLDFTAWVPEPGEVHGYLIDGLPSTLVRSASTLASLRARLLDAGAVMAVVLPEGPHIDARIAETLGTALVRCVPPSAEHVFAARLKAAVPDEEERRKTMRGLPKGFAGAVLSRDGSPQDVMDVLEAVMDTAHNTRGNRTTLIRAVLEEKADREISTLLPDWFGDHGLRCALISAAVFAGWPPDTVAEQAGRLARLTEAGPAQQEYRFPADLLRPAGVRVETVRHGHGDPPIRMVFARYHWAGAILRSAWRGPHSRALARWLQSVNETELIEPAGRALALSAAAHPQPTRLTHIRASAVSRGHAGPRVAATALRTIMAESRYADETAARLGGWASGSDERLRYVTALACGGGFRASPLKPAMNLIVRLIRSLDDDHHPHVAKAVQDALMSIFHQGDRPAVLRELRIWTESGAAEARYATAIFPRLLAKHLSWFHECAKEETEIGSVVVLIRRTLRSRRSGAALRDPMLAWRRFAVFDPGGDKAFQAVLTAAREDRHPHVRQFLTVLDRHT